LVLEEFLKDAGNDVRDRYAAGVFLFALYAISRWSDLKVVQNFFLDVDIVDGKSVGFVEFRTFSHKTASQVAKHGLPMPLVAPIWGLTAPPWGIAWKVVADEANLSFGDFSQGPLLPAPTKLGMWGMRSTSSTEATKWLLEILSKQFDSLEDVSSHSLKCTCLSWMAKAGGDPNHRLILGHRSTGKASLETYSRDMLSAPLRALEEILRQVRVGALHPDRTRSGHVQSANKDDCRETAQRGVQESSDSSSSSSSSTSSDDLSSGPEDEAGHWTQLAKSHQSDQGPTWDNKNMFQHRQSRIIHLEADSEKEQFFCGIHRTVEHEAITSSPFLETRKCKRCERALAFKDSK